MRKALLLWTLFTPLVIASEVKIKEDFSSETPSIKKTAGENIEDWKFRGDFNNGSYNHGFNSSLTRNFEIEPLFEDSIIKNVSLCEYKDGNYRIFISTIKKIEIKKKITINSGETLFTANKVEDFSEFLSFFYQNEYLPDCIVDLILQKMADQKIFVEDFRLTSAKLALKLNQASTEQSREEDVQAFLTQKLDIVTNPIRRQDLIANIVVNLQKENASSPLIKKLTQEVTDPTATPLYAEIKLIQSAIEMNDSVTQPDSQARYHQALQTLLDIPLNFIKPEVQKQIDAQTNILVKNICNNDQPSYDPLPLALQGLKLDSHSMLGMLMHISQLTQENKKLQQQITKELAVDRSN